MGEGKDAKEHAKGHRERLRARYRLSGEAGLQGYELLELLLTYAIPRRDTKLLAKKLLERFGTLARVIEAEPHALEEIDGIGPQAATFPSNHDRELTQALKAAAAIVGVRFLDHLIIGDGEPFSFKASGLMT